MEAAAPLWKCPHCLTNELGKVQSRMKKKKERKNERKRHLSASREHDASSAAETYMNDLNKQL